MKMSRNGIVYVFHNSLNSNSKKAQHFLKKNIEFFIYLLYIGFQFPISCRSKNRVVPEAIVTFI